VVKILHWWEEVSPNEPDNIGRTPLVHAARTRVPNSPTGQVLEAGPGWPVLVMAIIRSGNMIT